MNIVLIGYRGTGKTVVAEILSDRLNMKKIGMDEEIVKKAGISIPEIVEKYGWKKFRDIETALAEQFSRLDGVILDTGGGVVERAENVEALKKNGRVFWLKASVDTIVKRIESCTDRPALTPGASFTDEVSEVLEGRIPKYAGASHYEIDTDGITPVQVADRISEIWNRG
ncbi:MAG: shikimate kinase [Deltaproteobacteria bacterium]|nr:MAG: shikimate kinase [Deltaproteobacteria bacterium]